MVPETGRWVPASMLKSVLFPAPLGPMMQRVSPRSSVQAHPADRGNAPEVHVQVLGLHQGGGHSAPLARSRREATIRGMRRRSGSRPFGNRKTMATKNAPMIIGHSL